MNINTILIALIISACSFGGVLNTSNCNENNAASTTDTSNSNCTHNATEVDNGNCTHNATEVDNGNCTHDATEVDNGNCTHNATEVDNGNCTHNATEVDNRNCTQNATEVDNGNCTHDTTEVDNGNCTHDTIEVDNGNCTHDTIEVDNGNCTHNATEVDNRNCTHNATEVDNGNCTHNATEIDHGNCTHNATKVNIGNCTHNANAILNGNSTQNITGGKYVNCTGAVCATYNGTRPDSGNATLGPSVVNTPHTLGGNKFIIAKEHLTVKVEAIVSINQTFTKELESPFSKEYINISSQFKKKLDAVYNGIKGFAGVEIERLSNGSIQCHYTVYLNAAADLRNIASQIRHKNITVNGSSTGMELSAESFIKVANDMTGNLCKVIVNKTCEEAKRECQSSDDGIECVDICSIQPNQCGNNRECYYDTVLARFGCRCQVADDAIYSGPDCTRRVEILPLSFTEIITITAVSSGVALAILTAAIICLVVRNRKLKSKATSENRSLTCDQDQKPLENPNPKVTSDRRSNEHVTESGLRRGDQLSHQWQSLPNASNYSGLRQSPEYGSESYKEFVYISPRDQNFPRDQISARDHSSLTYEGLRTPSINHTNSSFYDTIDTTMKFEIRRPFIKMDKF